MLFFVPSLPRPQRRKKKCWQMVLYPMTERGIVLVVFVSFAGMKSSPLKTPLDNKIQSVVTVPRLICR